MLTVMADLVTDEEHLGSGDLYSVQIEVHAARVKWFYIGSGLHVPLDVLESIKVTYSDPKDCLCEVLMYWLKGVNPKPTWRALVDVLKSCLVAGYQLAQRLEDKYCCVPHDTQNHDNPASGGGTLDDGKDHQAISTTPTFDLPDASSLPKRNLEEEIDELEGLFENLVDKTSDALEDANVSLRRLKKCFTNLRVSARHQHYKFLAGNLSAILDAKSIDGVFAILGLYWDFLNCGLLEVVVHKFEDKLQNVKPDMEKYLERLRQFRQRTKLRDFIDKWTHGLPPNFSCLTMEMREEWMDRTLEDLEQSRRAVSRQLSLEPYSMLFKKAETGSVVLSWALHCSFPVKDLVLLTTQQLLDQHGILAMMFKGVCVSDCELHKNMQSQEEELMMAKEKLFPSDPKPWKPSSPYTPPLVDIHREVERKANAALQQQLVEAKLQALQAESRALQAESRVLQTEQSLLKNLKKMGELHVALNQREAQLEWERREREHLQKRVRELEQQRGKYLEQSKPTEEQYTLSIGEDSTAHSEIQDLQTRLSQKESDMKTRELEIERLRNQLSQVQQQRSHGPPDPATQDREMALTMNIQQLNEALRTKNAEVEELRQELYHFTEEMEALRAAKPVEPSELYRMDRNPHGICLIINNHKFYHPEGPDKAHPDRGGAEIDQFNLAQTFRYLHYKVEVQENLTAGQMSDLMMQMCQRDHSHYDSFVCCILTHGDQDVVHGADSQPVSLYDLTGLMKLCTTLRGKPKIFFIQADRGDQEDAGFDLPEKDSGGVPPSITHTIPQEADFFFGYATPPRKAAYRSRRHGSWYTSELCKVFCEYGYHGNLSSMMKKVNNGVARAYTKDGLKQCAEYADRLRKEVHFFHFIKKQPKPQDV